MDPSAQDNTQSPAPPTAQQTLATAQNPDRSSLTPQSTAMPASSTLATAPTANAPLPTRDTESWGNRVYHGVLSALGGANDVSYARDPQTGKMIATQVKSGPGQQWKRIVAGAISGYGAAAATGATGPGSTSAKFGAGIQAGQKLPATQDASKRQQANEDFEAEQKAATSQAQNALLAHQVAKSIFDLGRAQVEASGTDLDRENTFSQVVSAGGEGSQDLGVFTNFDAVMKAFKANPELHAHQAGGRLIAIPHINQDGKVDGVHAALVSPDWLSSKINQDLPIAVHNYKDGKLEESTFTIPAGTLTGDQYSKLVMSQSKESLDAYTTQQKQDATDAHDRALEAEEYSAADKNRAEAALAQFKAGGAGADALVDEIGTGKMPVGSLAYLASRNPQLLTAVAEKYPDFDGSKIGAYVTTYKDFTSGKVSNQLNSGATALGHLDELRRLNTIKSHIPGTADYNAYQNKVDTLSTELAGFYGDTTIPAIAAIKKTLSSTLPGNRDAGIKTQTQSMGDKFNSFRQQWKNAAPSAGYEAQFPGMSPQAQQAFEDLQTAYAPKGQKQPAQQAKPQAQPAGATMKVPDKDGVLHWSDGKNDLGVVAK